MSLIAKITLVGLPSQPQVKLGASKSLQMHVGPFLKGDKGEKGDRGDKGDTGDSTAEAGNFTTDAVAYYILAKN